MKNKDVFDTCALEAARTAGYFFCYWSYDVRIWAWPFARDLPTKFYNNAMSDFSNSRLIDILDRWRLKGIKILIYGIGKVTVYDKKSSFELDNGNAMYLNGFGSVERVHLQEPIDLSYDSGVPDFNSYDLLTKLFYETFIGIAHPTRPLISNPMEEYEKYAHNQLSFDE